MKVTIDNLYSVLKTREHTYIRGRMGYTEAHWCMACDISPIFYDLLLFKFGEHHLTLCKECWAYNTNTDLKQLAEVIFLQWVREQIDTR